MSERLSVSCLVFVATPAVVLLLYGWFIVVNYWPYLNAQCELRSHDLAGLPEDVVGFGFWMWWPLIALLFSLALMSALSAVERRVRTATIVLSVFTLLSVVDYCFYRRLVDVLLRG